MVTVLAQEFFLTEILGRRVFLKRRRVGTLGDLAIVETGRLPEVSHLLVSRNYFNDVSVHNRCGAITEYDYRHHDRYGGDRDQDGDEGRKSPFRAVEFFRHRNVPRRGLLRCSRLSRLGRRRRVRSIRHIGCS